VHPSVPPANPRLSQVAPPRSAASHCSDTYARVVWAQLGSTTPLPQSDAAQHIAGLSSGSGEPQERTTADGWPLIDASPFPVVEAGEAAQGVAVGPVNVTSLESEPEPTLALEPEE